MYIFFFFFPWKQRKVKFNNVNQGESKWTLLSVWVFQTTQLTEVSYIEWNHPFQQENNQNWFPVGNNKKVSFLIPLFYFSLGHILIGIQPTSQLCSLSRMIWSFQATLQEREGFEVKPVLLLMKVCGQYGVNSGLSHSQEGCGFDPQAWVLSVWS